MKYNNNGEFNLKSISEALDIFCEETGRDRSEVSHTDTDFVDFILAVCMDLATGTSVLNFLRKAKELKSQNGNRYNPYQIECILKTYTNIVQARNYKRWNK